MKNNRHNGGLDKSTETIKSKQLMTWSMTNKNSSHNHHRLYVYLFPNHCNGICVLIILVRFMDDNTCRIAIFI